MVLINTQADAECALRNAKQELNQVRFRRRRPKGAATNQPRHLSCLVKGKAYRARAQSLAKVLGLVTLLALRSEGAATYQPGAK